ncbi:S41 family peptidase [Mastigocoleus testarum]|uniref:S41 family peptidase n=1 Tax=Mastigocoleus testarum TaxID=996925 RepID=UPI00040C46BF|nr:S41 family peptidase [Mastigocoleus testarum]
MKKLLRQLKRPEIFSLAIASLFAIIILLQWLNPPIFATQPRKRADILEQVWKTVNDNFYDPQLNGVDWKAMRKKYKPLATRTQSSEEFATVINRMLSELQTSHTHFYTQNEQKYYQLLGIFQPRNQNLQKQLKRFLGTEKIEYAGIGIFTKKINDKTFISGILAGTPAAGSDLKVGDRVISVDGKPYESIKSFAGKVGKKVKLLVQRTPSIDSQQEINVTPKMFDPSKMFLDVQKASRETIERNGKKIAYVHIWSYADTKYQEQLEEDLLYGRFRNADGLVLDLRDGWGGAAPKYLHIFTGKSPNITFIGRDRKPVNNNSQWKKPVVLLVNEGSRSGKEILAFGFKQHKIGPIVGSKTSGAVVGGSPFIMKDGSVLYLAVADVLINNKYRLEGNGVKPDISVPFSLEYSQGVDPQKQRAVEVAFKAVMGNGD